jgi:hypothetical protein
MSKEPIVIMDGEHVAMRTELDGQARRAFVGTIEALHKLG